MSKFRYELGDAMGKYAPDYLRRDRSIMRGLAIGAGGMLFALGVGYVAMRLADKRLEDVLARVLPGHNGHARQPASRTARSTTPQGRTEHGSAESGQASGQAERPTVHGTEGGEMPKTP